MNVFSKRISFVAAILFCFATLSAPALGQKVVGKNKKRKVIRISGGKAKGFIKGARVCFFGKKGKKVACGKVVRAGGKASFAKVSPKRFRRVRKGMTAKLQGAAGQAEGALADATDSVTQGSTSGAPSHLTNFKLGYIISFLSPATYEKLTYSPPAADASEGSVGSLWKADSTSSLSIFGFIAEGDFGIGDSMAASFGLRFRYYRDFIAQSDYSATEKNLYVETEQTASAMGFYTDFTFLNIGTSGTFFQMSSGLDYDMSTVEFKATQKDDDGEDVQGEIASATSSLSVISLRLGMDVGMTIFDPIGILGGINLLVPVAEMGASFSGKINDTNETLLSGSGDEDLETALDHKKASFGAEFI